MKPIKCGSASLFCPANSSTVEAAAFGHYTIPEIDTDEGKLVREGQRKCEGEYVQLSSACCLLRFTSLSTANVVHSSSAPSGKFVFTYLTVGHFCSGGIKKKCDGEGQYNDETGRETCKSARAGFKPISEYDRTGIVPCPVNTFSVGGQTNCENCLVGSFSNYDEENGSVGCTFCKPGRYKTKIAAGNTLKCEGCPKGRYAISGVDSIDDCKACEKGKYSKDSGATFCLTVR